MKNKKKTLYLMLTSPTIQWFDTCIFILDIYHPVNSKTQIQPNQFIKSQVKPKVWFSVDCHISIFKKKKKKKLRACRRQKLERQNSWQGMKHEELYPDLLQVWKSIFDRSEFSAGFLPFPTSWIRFRRHWHNVGIRSLLMLVLVCFFLSLNEIFSNMSVSSLIVASLCLSIGWW